MASLKDIRARIDSTRNTQQITKAMKLVSAAKLRKAQHQITNMRPYAQTLLRMLANIAVTGRVSHPLLDAPAEVRRVLLVVLSSDRGLCGGFNAQINRYTDAYLKNNQSKLEKIDIIFIGKRASDFFGRRGIRGLETILKLDKEISFNLADRLAVDLIKKYQSGEYQEIRLIFNEFKSAISQQVTSETLLPIDLSNQTLSAEDSSAAGFANDMIFEPSPEVMIESLLEKHFAMQIYRSMAESVASEHGARMSAMENATNNAKEVLNKLTLTYNKIRQEKITTELTEIVAGAGAV